MVYKFEFKELLPIISWKFIWWIVHAYSTKKILFQCLYLQFCICLFGRFTNCLVSWFSFVFPYSILHNNSFYGIIPTEIGHLQDIKMLDLGYNNFSGSIPSELQNILSLEFLWVRTSCNKCFSQINFTTWHWFHCSRYRFLKGNRLSGGLPVGLHELTRICESENQDINWLNRVLTARFATIRVRRLLLSKRKDSEMIHIPEHRVRIPPFQRGFPPLNSPLAPSPPEPIPTPPASPPIEQTKSKENKSNSSSKIYASIGATFGFLVVALSAVCFFYYCHRKTSTVVPLSATTSSKQLQTTAMEGW